MSRKDPRRNPRAENSSLPRRKREIPESVQSSREKKTFSPGEKGLVKGDRKEGLGPVVS